MRRFLKITAAVIAGLFGVCVLALLAFGALILTGTIPDTAAVPGEELPARALRVLDEEGLLKRGEVVIYYYSDGFLSYREDGNFFTDRAVVSYAEDSETGELLSWRAEYAEIEEIDVEYQNGILDNTLITVTTEGGGEFQLLVSNEEERDHTFFELLTATWERKRSSATSAEDRSRSR